jgi:hypothetical protein
MKQMEAKLQQAEQIMQEMATQYQKTMEEYSEKIQTVDNIIRENVALKEMLAKIESKRIEKNKKETSEIFKKEIK